MGVSIPSDKHTKNYGKSPFLMGKSTTSTGPFSSSQTVNVYPRVAIGDPPNSCMIVRI